MNKQYHSSSGLLRFAAPHIQAGVLGIVLFVLRLLCSSYATSLSHSMGEGDMGTILFTTLQSACDNLGSIFLALALLLFTMSILLYKLLPDTAHIAFMVRRGLFHPSHGNPLHLKDGELLPRIRCKRVGEGLYDLTISAQQSVTVDVIAKAIPSISAALNRRFQRYAVVATDTDTAFNAVTFRLDDVQIDRSLTITNVEQLRPQVPTLLKVDTATNIDLTTSGSMLVAGKTRSGKTTGVIALLLQVLLYGPDCYDSKVVIIDPKQAELSRLPHTVTLDENGEATPIIVALQEFVATIKRRQHILNDHSEQVGDAVKWWDADMHPCFLFIDEYVALRAILPKKAAKDSDYSLETFDGLVKRIVTMGASAGAFCIISIAEASVQEGGLPAMLRSAMSTRILFRPVRAEGLLIWDKEKIESLPERSYGPGDAWFSSTDGLHDLITSVHFPYMEFPVYRELGNALVAYYSNRNR